MVERTSVVPFIFVLFSVVIVFHSGLETILVSFLVTREHASGARISTLAAAGG
jgi:hypothetical protein